MSELNQLLTEAMAASAANYPALDCVLVDVDDRRTLQWRGAHYAPNTLYPLRSVTKSILATAFGIAWDDGVVGDLAFPFADAFPEYTTIQTPMYEHATTTAQVIAMTAGFDWPVRQPFRETRLHEFLASDDWTAYAVNLPIRAARIGRFGYCSPASHLISAFVQRAVNTTVEQFTAQRLFAPLGIENWQWDADAQGVTLGGWGLHLAVDDLMKIGKLHLAAGRWNGEQIVSSDWIALATQAHTPHYGYHWWLRDHNGESIYFAAGTGGQYLIVAPHLQLVAAMASRPDHPAWSDPLPLFLDVILPIVEAH